VGSLFTGLVYQFARFFIITSIYTEGTGLILLAFLLQLAVDTPVTTLRATRGGKQDDYVSF
jgi:hypothetical protein